MPESNPWKTLSSRVVYTNPWITVREDQVIRPDGAPGVATNYGVGPVAGFVHREFIGLITAYPGFPAPGAARASRRAGFRQPSSQTSPRRRPARDDCRAPCSSASTRGSSP